MSLDIFREAHRNHAEDAYFEPRPAQDGVMSRKSFCDGFDRGWNEAIRIEREACAVTVWMTLMEALEDDADDKGLGGWLREAEARIKARP